MRARLAFWFASVALLPLLVAGGVVYWQRMASLRALKIAQLETIRDLKVRQVNSWLDERSGDLRTISGSVSIRNLEDILRRQRRTRADAVVLEEARALLRRYLTNYDAFSELSVLNSRTGRVEISTRAQFEGASRSTSDYFTRPMLTRALHLGPIYRSKTVGGPTMVFSLPVFCEAHKGEHITGIIMARIDLENSLYDLLLDRTGMGDSGETLIVNESGLALNELRWSERAPLRLRLESEATLRSTHGETGTVEAVDYRGVPVLAAYTHIPRTGWGFVAKQDHAEIFAPVGVMLRELLTLLLLSVLVVSALAVYLAVSINRPTLELVEISHQVEAGDLSVRATIHRADELGRLCQSYNAMIESVAHQTGVLQGSAQVADAMVATSGLDAFAKAVLLKLVEVTDSHLGALYLRRQDDTVFSPVFSVGVDAAHLPCFDADALDGEFGRALATKRISHIRDIPADTVFVFRTVAGTALPREIITIPVLAEDDVLAVVSLGSLRPYTEASLDILQRIWHALGMGLANRLSAREAERLAAELGVSNEELRAVNEELEAQTEELREQTEELRDQAEELENQRRQVEEADRLKSEFLSNMSHELRTPLNSIMALSQLMISRGTGKDTRQDVEFLEVIERNGRSLLTLINDILDLSKIEAGRMDLVVSDFPPRQVVTAALETIRPMAQEKGLDLHVRAGDLPTLRSDEEKVHQILVNLLANAVKFTERGEVEVSVNTVDTGVAFAVKDTGIGIAPESLEHVFDEFRQLDGSITRAYGGTGLGLAISRKTARLLGGDISVRSSLGIGSLFTLVLPLEHGAAADIRPSDVPTAPPAAEPAASPERLGGDGPRTVLVVEDNEVAVLQIVSALEECGCRVTVAADGAEAMDALRREVPALMILDLMMPRVDGFQVLERVRADARTLSLPVLVLTAKELTAEERGRLRHNHIQELIQKGSVDRDQLMISVERILSGGASPPASATAAEPQAPAAMGASSGPLRSPPTAVPSSGTQLAPPATTGSPEPAPSAAAPAPLPPAVAAPEPTPPPGATGAILIVEDNPDNLLAITAILSDMGWACTTAQDGEEAVRMVGETHPVLILMDIQLPVLSGLEATRQIKSHPATAHIPIIALTARAMAGDRESILAHGCDDYLSKPLDPQELAEMVHRWLQE